MPLSESDTAAPSLEENQSAATPEQAPQAAPATPANYGSIVKGASAAYNVDPDILAGMIMKESALRKDVISGDTASSTGATGIAQFMPGTAKRFGIDPTDPGQSIFAMAAYMRQNLDKFDGNYDKAIAGYNWGENRDAFNKPDWQAHLPAETADYLKFVTGFASVAANDTGARGASAAPATAPAGPDQSPAETARLARQDGPVDPKAFPVTGFAAIPRAPGADPIAPAAPRAEPSLWDKVDAGVQTAASQITGLTSGALGMAGGFIGGVGGAVSTALSGGVQPRDGLEQAASEGGDKLTLSPVTPLGNEYNEAVGSAMAEAIPVMAHVHEMGQIHEAAAPVAQMAKDQVAARFNRNPIAAAAAVTDAAAPPPAAPPPGRSVADQLEAVRATSDVADRQGQAAAEDLANAPTVDAAIAAAGDLASRPNADVDATTAIHKDANDQAEAQVAATEAADQAAIDAAAIDSVRDAKHAEAVKAEAELPTIDAAALDKTPEIPETAPNDEAAIGALPVLRDDALPAVEQPKALEQPDPAAVRARVEDAGLTPDTENQSAVDSVLAPINKKIAETGGAPITYTAVERPDARPDMTVAEKLMQRVFGKDVVYVKAHDTRLFNGVHDTRFPDRVFLDVDTQHPVLAILGHELLHSLRHDAPDIYNDLLDRTKSITSHAGVYRDNLNAKRAERGLPPLDTDHGLEEFHADIGGEQFLDPKFIAALAKDRPQGFQKVAEAVKAFLAKTLSRIKDLHPFGMDKYVSDVEKVRDAYAEAFNRYADIGEPETAATTTHGAEADVPSMSIEKEDDIPPKIQALHDEHRAAEERLAAPYTATRDDGSTPTTGTLKTRATMTFRRLNNAVKEHTNGDTEAGLALMRRMNEASHADTAKMSIDTGTDDFKKWFGESKVVDENGAPKRVYTGTSKDKDFSKFNAPKNGIWFSEHAKDASDYAKENDSRGLKYNTDTRKYDEVNTADRVIPAYLSLKNPKVYDAWPDSVLKAANYKKAQGELFDRLKAEGHDGVIGPAGVHVAFKPEQIKSAIGNSGKFDPSNPNIHMSLADEPKKRSEAVSRVLRNLTPSEREMVSDKMAEKIATLMKDIPSANEMAAVAHAGSAKRGWYKGSENAIKHVFGVDAPRFTALLSALSPQTSVESNLLNALNTWKNWNAEGRPTNPTAIRRILAKSVEGSGTEKSVLDAWRNNSIRALTHENPAELLISGPKVNSFKDNLNGDQNEVTNDAWQSVFAGIEQKLFAGRAVKSPDGIGKTFGMKGPGYLAMSARTREAAAALTKLTGDTWTPAEVQETVWSWTKALTEMSGAKDETRTARQILADGGLTPDIINATPDFGTLFHNPTYSKILKDSGYGKQLEELGAGTVRDHAGQDGAQRPVEGKTAPFADDAQRRYENAAARRIEQLQAERGDAKSATIERRAQAALDEANDESAESESADTQRFSLASGVRGSDESVAVDSRPEPRTRGSDLRGLPSTVTVDGRPVTFGGFKPAQDAAAAYAKASGIDYNPPRDYAKVDPGRAKRVADAYSAMEHDPQNPRVKAAYDAMIKETLDQYQHILDTGLKVEFNPPGEDPYGNPRHAIIDVTKNNHLYIFPTDDGFGGPSSNVDVSNSPMLAPTEHLIGGKPALVNDIFRVVHDYFGHIKEGVGFRADGEENAWRNHAAMYSDAARPAVTTETRGQNSWVNYGPHAEANRTANGANTEYAPQKVGLMPEWTHSEGRADATVRLYRAESPTTKFDDVFDREGLKDFASDKVGTRFTSDPKYADYFRKSYGADATVRHIDVPHDVAEAGRINGYEHRIDETKLSLADDGPKKATDSAPFKQWFGKSVIKDNGEPSVMYHGTSGDFNSFDSSKGELKDGTARPTFVTHDPVVADHYASGELSTASVRDQREDGSRDTTGANIMPVHVRAEKPFDFENPRHVDEIVDRVFADPRTKTHTQGDGQEALDLDGKRTLYSKPVLKAALETGDWNLIEHPEIQRAIQAAGHDAFWVHEHGSLNLGVYKSEQLKSATGNRGTFDGKDPDIRMSLADDERKPVTTEDGVPKERSFLSSPGRAIADVFAKVKDDLLMKVSPMSLGNDFARATAKAYAIADRLARDQWQQFDRILKKNYTPEQLERMWDAADEENEIRSGRQEATPEKGLASLPDDQRATVEKLNQYGEELLQRARDLGMFEGQGVPYWAPRMAAVMGGDERGPQRLSTGSIGSDVTTTANSLKGRKYLTAVETDAAMKEHGGQLVRNIRTMPLAMARLERALAGRELINTIKDYGANLGIDTTSTGGDGFFTIDHPAFKTWGPKFTTDPTTGKTAGVIDQFGQPVFDRRSIHVANEFEGPLRSIMYEKPGAIYGALMSLKAKAMGLIMYSPLIHNAVEFGRAMAVAPGKVATLRIYFEGNKVKNDPVQRRAAIEDGLVPIGNRGGVQDITGITEDPEMTPGRSMSAKAIGGAVGLVNEKAGTAVKRGVDAAGDFWHGTLLWDRVADLQFGLYSHLKDANIKKGMDPQTAGQLAAHWANRYAGAVPNEAMSAGARKIANLTLFSRSFTLGNLGAMKDMFTGIPKDVQSQIKMRAGELGLAAAKSAGRRKAIAAFVVDVGLMYVANDITQDVLDKFKRDKSWGDIGQGYLERAAAFGKDLGDHPMDMAGRMLLNPFMPLDRLATTSTNEPGKENRVHYGNQEDGTATYLRVPVGKVGEDFKGWWTSPIKTANAKMSQFTKPMQQVWTNDAGFGHRVYDPEAKGLQGAISNAGKIALQFAKAQVPTDAIAGIASWNDKSSSDVDKAKVLAPLAGLTVSKGAPGGPAVGALYAADKAYLGAKQDIMPDVQAALKNGDFDKAKELMTSIKMPPPEQKEILKHFANPSSRLSKAAMEKFGQRASDEAKTQMETIRGR